MVCSTALKENLAICGLAFDVNCIALCRWTLLKSFTWKGKKQLFCQPFFCAIFCVSLVWKASITLLPLLRGVDVNKRTVTTHFYRLLHGIKKLATIWAAVYCLHLGPNNGVHVLNFFVTGLLLTQPSTFAVIQHEYLIKWALNFFASIPLMMAHIPEWQRLFSKVFYLLHEYKPADLGKILVNIHNTKYIILFKIRVIIQNTQYFFKKKCKSSLSFY